MLSAKRIPELAFQNQRKMPEWRPRNRRVPKIVGRCPQPELKGRWAEERRTLPIDPRRRSVCIRGRLQPCGKVADIRGL
jgi:hypothetical protein